MSGGDLAGRALQQAKRFETEILVTRWVRGIAPAAGGYAVTLDGDDVITTRAIVVATGICAPAGTSRRRPRPARRSRSRSACRVVSGVGEGSMVVAYIHQYLEA